MQKEIQKSMSCREVVTRHLRIFVSDGIINERKKIRRSRIKSGMTPLFNNNAFTLIELLVVVLIIGILAAVALPQYQKAVEKSRAAQALTLLKTVGNAFEAHHQANGEWATSFDELAVDIPWTGTTKFISSAQEARSNGQWSLQIEHYQGNISLFMGRLDGKYGGAGFQMVAQTPTLSSLIPQQIYCIERKTASTPIFDTALADGAYCAKIMQGTFKEENQWGRYYRLPY